MSNKYNDYRNTQSFQQSSNKQNKEVNNPFPKNLKQTTYQRSQIKKNTIQNLNQRYTIAAPFPSDNLFDLKSTNSVLGFIPPEPLDKFTPSVQTKKININRNNNISNEMPKNAYLKKNMINENFKKNIKNPIDDISNNNSSINKIPMNDKSNKSSSNNKIHFNYERNPLQQTNTNDIKNNGFINHNISQQNVNKNIINNINNNFKNEKQLFDESKINKNKSSNNFINKLNINNNINNNNSNINSQNNSSQQSSSLLRTNLQNQFMNRNYAMSLMLKKIQFFEKINKIGQERMKLFEKEFQKETFFMKKDFFDNIFIKKSEIDNLSPLTLIFHFIFNPEIEILQFPYKKNFFESIFQMRGDKDIKINYSPNDLRQVPKYFNDFEYVNNLFNNFNENDLVEFLNEIEKWKKTFSFELQFVHPLKNNIGQNQIEINDIANVYFVSPNDLIVDYHSYADNFPLSDTFVSISQYNFHCDIKYDINTGRFAFKTTAIVYNKLQIIKENIIQNVIKREANSINSIELPIHTWKPLLLIIGEESKKNKIITDNIFKNHIKKTLNKYSKNRPQMYGNQKIITKKENENTFKNINEINIKENTNISEIHKKIKSSVFNSNINIDANERKLNDFDFNNGNKEVENKINKSNYINEKFNQNTSKDNIFENNFKDKIIQENIDKIDNNENNKIEPAITYIGKKEKDQFLFYGVLITFFLFIFKTMLNLEYGDISFENFFNFLKIIIIGFMLVKNHIIDNNQQ